MEAQRRDPMIDRERELAAVEQFLVQARPGLTLLVGPPGSGKGRLLQEVRVRAPDHSCRVVPSTSESDFDAPWLVIDEPCTVEQFRQRLSESPDSVSAEETGFGQLEVVLIYGYRPAEDFHEWFVREFIRLLAESVPPRHVVLAATASDLTDLEPRADAVVVLGPLPRDAVLEELRAIDATISDRLDEREFDAYADAIISDPSILGALRELLPLSAVAGTPDGETPSR